MGQAKKIKTLKINLYKLFQILSFSSFNFEKPNQAKPVKEVKIFNCIFSYISNKLRKQQLDFKIYRSTSNALNNTYVKYDIHMMERTHSNIYIAQVYSILLYCSCQ